MVYRLRLLLSLIFLLPMQALPQDDESQANTESDLIGLLEFLGEFETEDGAWISPEDLVQDIYTELDEPVTRSVTRDATEIEDEND